MPSSASTSVLAELQAAGENLNTWGVRLNTAIQMLEAASHGLTSHTLTANVTLTYTNYTLTNGTDYVQKIASASDGSYTLTMGGYERSYLIWNDSSYDQTIATSGGGDSVTVYAGEVVPVYCDATNMTRLDLRQLFGDLNAGGNKLTNIGTPTENTDAASKAYVDGLAFETTGALPGQTSATKYASITSDGSAASWEQDIQPERITSNTTAVARRRPYFCDMSGGAFTLTLPASPAEGDFVAFMTDDNASSNLLTIGRNSQTIGGLSEDATCDLNGFSGLLLFTQSTWKVFSR